MKVYLELKLKKGVDYSSIQNCAWPCHFLSVKKLLSRLLDNFLTVLKTNQQRVEMT